MAYIDDLDNKVGGHFITSFWNYLDGITFWGNAYAFYFLSTLISSFLGLLWYLKKGVKHLAMGFVLVFIMTSVSFVGLMVVVAFT
jgi:hypothetical protein